MKPESVRKSEFPLPEFKTPYEFLRRQILGFENPRSSPDNEIYYWLVGLSKPFHNAEARKACDALVLREISNIHSEDQNKGIEKGFEYYSRLALGIDAEYPWMITLGVEMKGAYLRYFANNSESWGEMLTYTFMSLPYSLNPKFGMTWITYLE